jgi:hypothetical protein
LLNDGNVYWHIRNSFDGALVDTLEAGSGDDTFIADNAAVLTNHDLCWGFPDGYGTSWYQAICIRYVGDSLLDFDVLVDTEGGFDFLFVQTDSACAAATLVDYENAPSMTSYNYRDDVEAISGQGGVHYEDVALDGYGTADTHCVYIALLEDGAANQQDGLQPTANGAGLVVDNIVLTGSLPANIDFDGGDSPYTFQNLQDNVPFGQWSRVFQNISDNDVCSGNITCAWLDTDHTNPTVANNPTQAYAPNQYVMKSWKDNAVIGPWVSLASTQNAVGTVLSFRRFPGNSFATSKGMQNWSVRSKTRIDNTDSPAGGDSIDCVTSWSHSFQWNSLSLWTWITSLFDMSSNVAVGAREIQMRFRQADWQWIAGVGPPTPFQPDAGPFFDRVRIGRRVLSGPAINEGIDNRYQTQDSAPKIGETGAWPGPDYAQDPGGDIFGTTPFSRSTDAGINDQTANLILGDSTTIIVTDVRGGGGIASVEWYGCIVAGPHAGKAPPPYTVGGNGFFAVPADSAYNGTLQQPGYWAIDMDDNYFRGGDQVLYFWLTSDVQGGYSSWPPGMSAPPADLAEAEAETGGLFEWTALPAIEWDPAYLAAVAADERNDPTQQEIDNSSQKNCILYYNHINARRRSGDANRTPFQTTLDQLGYKGHYDVFDHSGLGNSNNFLGAHMTVAQARGYSLIVMDAGARLVGAPIIPDGVDWDGGKIDMDTWYTSWLQAVGQGTSIPNHTFWMIGQDWSQEGQGVQLEAQAQVSFVAPNQATSANPIAVSVAAGLGGCVSGVTYALDGGCPIIRSYDAIAATGTAVETHTYDADGVSPVAPGTKGAVVMNADVSFGSNTIMMSHPWSDIRDFGAPGTPEPEEELLAQVLSCVLEAPCQESPDPVDVPGENPPVAAPPLKTVLHQNVPNPFNPVTTIKFDLARDGHVSLNIYDVAGRLVRTLVNEKMSAGHGFEAKWNGLDNTGNRTSSGVYFYRLVTADFSQTNKMVLMK